MRQHDVTGKGRSGIQGPQTATAVTGVERNGVQTGDEIMRGWKAERAWARGEGDLYSRAKRRGRAIPDLAG